MGVEVPEKFATLGLTYDDVLLLPGHSDLAPADIDMTTRLTRETLANMPCGAGVSPAPSAKEIAVAN